MLTVKLGGVVLAIDDSSPLGELFVDQFDYVTSVETRAADVTLMFRPGFVRPPDGCVKVLGHLWVDGDQLFIDEKRPSSRLQPWRGGQRYQAHVRGNPLVEPTEITVYHDETLVRNSGRVASGLQKLLDTEYSAPAEQFVRRILTKLLEPLLHQRLLATGGGFMRVGGVAHETGAVLFSGWGGVGKSSICSELVSDHGYAFVGDPLVAVTDDGDAHPYRKRLTVTPRSIAAGETTYEQLMAGRPRLDRAQWDVRSRLLGSKGTRRRVLPSTQYGEWDPTRVDVPLEAVVTLVVEDRETIELEAASPADVAARAASTIAWQFRGYSDVLLASHAAAPRSWPSVETVETRSAQVYERALDDVDTYLMYVPVDSTSEQRVEVLLNDVLRPQWGYIEGAVGKAA